MKKNVKRVLYAHFRGSDVKDEFGNVVKKFTHAVNNHCFAHTNLYETIEIGDLEFRHIIQLANIYKVGPDELFEILLHADNT